MTLFPGVALITGAASGIGRATAISFAREGCCKIAIADQNTSGLDETEKMIQSSVAGSSGALDILNVRTNVLSETEVDDLIDRVAEHFGRIDYCVNCAGILGNGQSSTDTSIEAFDRINGVNYRGCWLSSRAELAQLQKQDPLPTHDGRPGNRGSIVNFASQLGIVGRPAAPAYCASKAAVISMTRCDAIDYSASNIRVNCVCPGVITTPMTKDRLDTGDLADAVKIAPMQRAGTAQEVADVVLFLSSSKASFVQGAAVVVDGGYVIN